MLLLHPNSLGNIIIAQRGKNKETNKKKHFSMTLSDTYIHFMVSTVSVQGFYTENSTVFFKSVQSVSIMSCGHTNLGYSLLTA